MAGAARQRAGRGGGRATAVAVQFATVDEYVASFPQDVQDILTEIRHRIQEAVPAAEETISYRIPAMTLGGKQLVYFAAWKQHISVYPVPAADPAFERELAPYLATKGTLKFPLTRPIPYDLIARVATLLARQRTTRP
jgi:uncharacterized protein YdhG (YjbR/CyaY superfamily)